MSEYDSSLSFYLKADTGLMSVGMVDDIVLKDDRRNRELPIKIYYPQEPGSFPAIVFSHGTGGSKESFAHLGNFWASHGYICIHPTHVGSDFSVLKRIGLQAILELINDPEVWSERPQDISFLIDSLPVLEERVPQISGKIDRSFIGVAGHSYGAYTTMLLAGATVAMPGDDKASFPDERISAFLAISPPGTDRQGLTRNSWETIHAPVMTVSGSKDQGLEGKPPSWRREAFNYMPLGDKYHVLIEGANHFSFDPDAGIARTAFPRLAIGNNIGRGRHNVQLESTRLIKSYLQNASIAFWDAYLKFQTTAKAYLISDALPRSSQGDVSIFLK